MKRVRFASGIGPGQVTVPGGQLLTVSMVPGAAGSWARINESDPIFVPAGTTLDIQAEDLGAGLVPIGNMTNRPDESGCGICGPINDMYPGNNQIVVEFITSILDVGSPPQSWLVIYNG